MINAEAETVAAWAYRNLLRTESEPFPYKAFEVKSPHLGGGVKLIPVEKPKRPRQKKLLDGDETCKMICTIASKLNRVVNQIEQVAERGDFSKEPNAFEMASKVGGTVGRLNKLLLRLVETPNNPRSEHAVKQLVFYSLGAAIELEGLSHRNLEIVKSVARSWGAFPVAYSPHKDRKREIEKLVTSLAIGRNAPENVWNQRASFGDNQTVLGIYAIRAMQVVLRPLREGQLRKRLLAEVRGSGIAIMVGLNSHPLTVNEKTLLVRRGWPMWILDAVDLPPITKETSQLWAKTGWVALKEAAGGDITSIPELAKKGESNAQYARRRATTEKGKKGRHSSRKETQIKKLFIKAFVARFGSDTRETSRALKSP
ncbi:MAG TPA: hypothetical protein VNU95_14945 [Candidatus Acidoferrales bacterium]|jgi:hypothetical protein|nr:hypothetical protein [Candidatus Acidoferrales bacterium]